MKKYRIRLKNGRVIGPITPLELPEMAAKGHIDGSEDYQLFPTGDWKKIEKFEDLAEMLKDLSVEKPSEDSTFLKKISKKEIQDSEVEADMVEPSIAYPEKFKYEKRTPFSDRPEIEDVTGAEEVGELRDEVVEPKVSIEDLNVESEQDTDKNLTLTKTVTEKAPSNENQDKTLINTDTLKYLEELKKQKAKEEEELQIQKKLEAEILPEVDMDNDSTQFIDLSQLKADVSSEIKQNESEFKKEKKEYKKELAEIEKNILRNKQLENEDDDDEEDERSSPIKKVLIIGAVLALVIVVLFPDEGKKELEKITIQNPEISFPIQYDIPSKEKAAELYNKAIDLLKKNNTYKRRIVAARFFKQSLENSSDNNKAAGQLIFLYSQLLENSTTKIDDANTIFKLVQIYKNKAISDPTFAAGIALFYLNMEKNYAAVKVIEKFNAVKKNAPSLEMFAVYLKSLVSIGDLIKAKAVATKLETVDVKKRPLYVHVALIEYYNFISDFEKSSKLVIESRKIFKKSVPLMLNHAKLLVYDEDFKTLDKVLKKIRIFVVENSKVYYAKYLEYKALYAVSQGKVPNAIKYFQKALKIHESTELRSRLASLSESTNPEANNIIAESKSLQLVNNSKAQLKKNNWKFAFKDALEATRIAPNFIPAKIYLAKLQTSQSLFKEAIDTLEALYEADPLDKNIIYALIDTYIVAYKFTDVKRMLTLISGSDMRNDPRFFSMSAKYYVYKEDFANGIPWLQRAINKNPLDDENVFFLAKMYIKYNKFDKGKMQLNKAMDLDPSKIEYRISFSKILYEIDGADAATGYLYTLLRDFPDNPKLLSQIGIFQYRSGQIKSFNATKEKLSSLPYKDTTLYEFLIEAAKLDDKLDEVIKNSRKLIQLDPGNLKIRLNLGKTFMEMDKYKDALVEFKAIENRLDTYPNLQLYMSKLFLLTDDFEKAKDLAKKEIKANSSSEFGYILLGDIHSKEKDYLQAEKQYKIAQKINGDNVDMLIGLAKINFKKSQYDLALDLFLKARNNAPDRSEIHKLLGDAYRKMSQSSLAIESYKLFLELSPTSKYKDEINTYMRMMQ